MVGRVNLLRLMFLDVVAEKVIFCETVVVLIISLIQCRVDKIIFVVQIFSPH